MKVLLVGNKPAYPKVDGGSVASAAFLNDLISAGCDVHYALLHTEKHPFERDAFPVTILDQISLTTSFVDTKVRKLDALKFLFNKKSFNVERFYKKEFESKVIQLLSENSFDAVIFDNVFSARYQEVVKIHQPTLPCFIRSHNVEFEIWEGLAQSSGSAIVRWYLKRLAKDLKRFEIETSNASSGILTITEDDKSEFSKLGITAPTIYIGVSVIIPEYTHNYENKSLFHLGAMNWRPNVEAVDTVLKYLPTWLETDSEITFAIAGVQSSERYDHLENESIEVKGFVPDLQEFISSQGILVAPIQSGSGVRIKLLEMMAFGVPIITTSLGAQGIADQSGVELADNHETMAEAVYTLRNDENKRRELGQKAKSIITLHHNSETISKKIREFISQ
jgi:glycosyltransferase involved in cell wall biosynthesis